MEWVKKQVIPVQKLVGLPPPALEITWASSLDSEEPSLEVLRLSELQCTNSSSISYCQRSKSAILFPCNINYNINSLLRLRIRAHIIYIGRA